MPTSTIASTIASTNWYKTQSHSPLEGSGVMQDGFVAPGGVWVCCPVGERVRCPDGGRVRCPEMIYRNLSVKKSKI